MSYGPNTILHLISSRVLPVLRILRMGKDYKTQVIKLVIDYLVLNGTFL